MANNQKQTIARLRADAYRFCNERARLDIALYRTLRKLGVPKTQANKIVDEVKKCNFKPLCKCLKIKW